MHETKWMTSLANVPTEDNDNKVLKKHLDDGKKHSEWTHEIQDENKNFIPSVTLKQA